MLIDSELAKAIRGFSSQRTFKLFTEIDDDESSSVKDESGSRINSQADSSNMFSQPRINLKKEKLNRDSESQEKHSVDSQTGQNAPVTPVLGQQQQRRYSKNTGSGFTGHIKQMSTEQSRLVNIAEVKSSNKDQNSQQQSSEHLPRFNKDSRHDSQDKDSKDRGGLKDSEEHEENYDRGVAPLPAGHYKRGSMGQGQRFGFKDDGLLDNNKL